MYGRNAAPSGELPRYSYKRTDVREGEHQVPYWRTCDGRQLVARSEVFVPISLLETTELTASEKLVRAGLALDADARAQPRSPQVRPVES